MCCNEITNTGELKAYIWLLCVNKDISFTKLLDSHYSKLK